MIDPAGRPQPANYEAAIAALQHMVRSRDLAGLPETTEALSRIVETIPPNGAQRASAVNNLGNAMHLWFEATGRSADLREAIRHYREALDSARRNDPQLSLYWSNLSLALLKLGRRGQRLELIDEAAEAARQSAQLSPRGSHSRIAALLQLVDALRLRGKLAGAEDDEVVAVLREAAVEAPVDLPERPMLLLRVGTSLVNQFRRDNDVDNLDAAVQLLYEAAEVLPAGQHARLALSRLGLALRLRFDEDGDPEDLRYAVDVLCRGAADTSRGDENLATLLFHLAGAAVEHFDCTGGHSALDRAVEMLYRSVSRLRADDRRRASVLLSFSELLHRRFGTSLDPTMLDAAAEFADKAAACADVLDEDRGSALRALASCLIHRFELAGSTDDLDRAAVALDELDRLAPADGPVRWGYWMQRGQLAMREHEQSHGKNGLNTAIAMYRRVLDAMPEEDPERAAVAVELGNALQRQSKHNRRRTYRLAYTLLHEAAELRTAPAGTRMRAATLAGHFAAEASRWDEAAAMFKAAMALLPLVSRFGPAPDAVQRYELTTMVADAVACVVRDGAPKQAVELLEHGRCLLLAQALGNRDEQTELADELPALATDLRRVRRLLDYLPDNVVGAATRRKAMERQRDLAERWTALVAEVRTHPAFEHYLEPPAFEQLSGAAADGPVVLVNVSAYGSDALLVTAGEAVGLSLPSLDIRNTAKYTRLLLESSSAAHIREVLDWIWQSVADPVFNVLNYYYVTTYGAPPPENQPWPRIWWCPTGPAAFLPLHAAGSDGPPGTGLSVLERTVPSYTPTLQSLLHAREAEFPIEQRRDPRVVLGNRAAHTEPRLLAQRWPSTKVLELTESARPTVLTALTEPGPVHFACQGTQRAHDCASGRLIGTDGSPMFIGEIAQLRIPSEFAYVSANEVTVEQGIPPDAIAQLLPLLQHAGFKHVVGPLWPVQDGAAIIDALYTDMDDDGALDPSGAAVAVHRVVRALRQQHPHDPRLWAAHIHVGP
ncbi:CHAT domain-containing protein [Saccharopolyspora sp. K220]|uniref:CHAT domain-containing protein n=1 Tax=Saccharopolyspora soli TaxID=2926618 RepID=UPI001F5903AA|nr:CHAT domain-containing protein [Saccharopolyspora soli]MCI2423140.1 CHAT domain-containing protein [Saccharopolyspora soli]